MLTGAAQRRVDRNRRFICSNQDRLPHQQNGLSICPVFVLRMAGSPARFAAQMRPTEFAAFIDSYYREFETGVAATGVLCRALEAHCPNLRDSKAIHALINVKRRAFNMRVPRSKDMRTLGTYLPTGLLHSLERSVAEIARLADCRNKILELHPVALEQTGSVLDEIAMSSWIQDFIALNVPRLHAKLSRLVGDLNGSVSSKESRAIRASVLNYILRGSVKTSPHSSLGFTSLARLTPGGGADPRRRIDLGDRAMAVTTRLRHAPIQHVFQALLHRRSALRDEALMRLNPTLRRGEKGWSWRKILYNEAAGDRVFGVNEASVTLPPRPIVALLVDAYDRTNPGKPLPLGTLVRALRARLPQSSWAQADRGLSEAISQELLVPVIETGAQEDILAWAARAAAMLHRDRTIEVQTCLARIKKALGRGPTKQWPRQNTDIAEAFAGLAEIAGLPTAPSSFQPLVHDDWRVAGPAISINLDALTRPLEDLTAFARVLPLIEAVDGRPQLAARIKTAFIRAYGRDAVCDDVGGFLGSLPANVLIGPDTTADLGESQKLLAAQGAEFIAGLVREARMGSEIRLDPSDVADLHARMPACFRARPRAHCLHLQFFPPDADGRCVVVNQIFPGNARMMSRFLSEADPEAVAAVRDYLEPGDREGARPAVPGVFGFNANLHVQLAEAEFDLPPFQPDRRGVPRLHLDHLRLGLDARTNRLRLMTNKGRPLSPQFFGILVPQRMPRLHQLLDAIGDNSAGVVPLSRLVGERMAPDQDGIVHIPRISIGSVVLCRATMIAPVAALPRPVAQEAAFFLDLQTWRRRHDLPSEVFYQRPRDRNIATAYSAGNSPEPSIHAQRPWKSAKPMYLDFNNPLCVRVFRQNLAKRPEPVLISEALPTPDMAAARIGDEAHMFEISMELRWQEQS